MQTHPDEPLESIDGDSDVPAVAETASGAPDTVPAELDTPEPHVDAVAPDAALATDAGSPPGWRRSRPKGRHSPLPRSRRRPPRSTTRTPGPRLLPLPRKRRIRRSSRHRHPRPSLRRLRPLPS